MKTRLNEDNNGFVQFPLMETEQINGNYKTLVYIASFDENEKYILSNVSINLPKENLLDDITGEKFNKKRLVSCICIGWCDFSFKNKEGFNWIANFRDLTLEGRNLYYSIKKLHNNKEVRILTFNSKNNKK